MRLPKRDLELFNKLHLSLLLYVNQQLGVAEGVSTAEELRQLPLPTRAKVRDALIDRLDLIDSFAKENPFGLSSAELAIVLSWKSLVKARFFVVRYLANYTVFLDPRTLPKAYGVLALADSFEDRLGPDLPIPVEGVLLPFKNRIIYDGIMSYHKMLLSPGFTGALDASYEEAKTRYGIITSLPFSEEGKSGAELLKSYLKTERGREQHLDEIRELVANNPSLLALYHQEIGKIHAREYKEQLREIGLADGWFAIVEGLIVASGKTKGEVEQIVRQILPPEKEGFAYIFHFKGS